MSDGFMKGFWLFSVLILLLNVAACNAPSAHFRGLEPTRVTVQGSTFDIRQRDDLVEAIRVNSQYAPRLGKIGRRAEIAIEQVTNCPVKWIRGDAALLLAKLKCGAADDLAVIGQETRTAFAK